MPDTTCMLTPEQEERAVQGLVHQWDYENLVRSTAPQVTAMSLVMVNVCVRDTLLCLVLQAYLHVQRFEFQHALSLVCLC